MLRFCRCLTLALVIPLTVVPAAAVRGQDEAADRGVRVRILLDDIKLKGAEDDEWASIVEQHPNIRFKIFNPWTSREGTGSMIGEFVGSRIPTILHAADRRSWPR